MVSASWCTQPTWAGAFQLLGAPSPSGLGDGRAWGAVIVTSTLVGTGADNLHKIPPPSRPCNRVTGPVLADLVTSSILEQSGGSVTFPWAETVQIGGCSLLVPQQGPAVYTFNTTFVVRARGSAQSVPLGSAHAPFQRPLPQTQSTCTRACTEPPAAPGAHTQARRAWTKLSPQRFQIRATSPK